MNDEQKPTRLLLGEAYMFCRECGARLYSFDGKEDADMDCPYKKDSQGRCTDIPKVKK
jgi:hypothetical protein